MASKDVSKVLRSLEGAWQQAESRVAGNLPDAEYLAKPTNMYVDISKSNRIQVVSIFKIMEGKYKDQEIRKYDGIDNDISMSWFKGYMEVLGIDIPDDISDLPGVLEDYINSNTDLVQLNLRTRDGFQNAFVREVIEEGSSDNGGDGGEEAPPEEPEEEQPRRSAAKKPIGKTSSKRR